MILPSLECYTRMKNSIHTNLAVLLAGLMISWGCQSRPAPEEEVDPAAASLDEVQQQENQNMEERGMVRIPVGVDVQGHRGARGLRPESTLPSFEIALDYLVDTLELDLHLSRDDKLIIWHDPMISRELCALEADAEEPALRSLSARELSDLRCDRNPDPDRFPEQTTEPTTLAGDDFSIITLDRLFDFVDEYANSPEKTDAQRQNARTVRFNIETKRVPDHPEFIGDGFDGESPAVFEHALVELIASRGLKERVNMQSFDHRALWAARQIADWLTLAVLEREIETPFAEFVEKGATIWSPRARHVTAETLEAARAAGLKVIPWTVNAPEEMERLIALGVDGIITDRPDLLVAYR